MSYRRLVWIGLLVVALAALVSGPAATTLVTCVPLNAISASPRAPAEEPAADLCAGMSEPRFGWTPEITQCWQS